MSNSLKGIVIAGNYREYLNWLKNNNYNKKDYLYARKDNWKGVHNVPIVTIGTWYKRKDISVNVNKMEQMVNQNLKEV